MISKLVRRFFLAVVALMAVSGLAQMPIFKRYYVADLPGLGWLAEYYFTHKLHYVGAALFLGLLAWLVTRWIGEWSKSWRLSASGWFRVMILGGIVLTGVLRMYKNQPGVSYTPEFTMVVDWAHLGLVVVWGLAALALKMAGKGRYLRSLSLG